MHTGMPRPGPGVRTPRVLIIVLPPCSSAWSSSLPWGTYPELSESLSETSQTLRGGFTSSSAMVWRVINHVGFVLKIVRSEKPRWHDISVLHRLLDGLVGDSLKRRRFENNFQSSMAGIVGGRSAPACNFSEGRLCNPGEVHPLALANLTPPLHSKEWWNATKNSKQKCPVQWHSNRKAG